MTFAMSMSNLSIDGEFRYIIQWFNEWSELQRDDFIPVLVDCLNQGAPTVYVNGVVNAVANAGIADRPMSLFQCRIKLFREWTPKWSTELRHKLKDRIIEIDSKVGEKIIQEIKGHIDAHSNGVSASDNNDVAEVNAEVIAAAVAVVEATEQALNVDDRLTGTTTTVDNNATATAPAVLASPEVLNETHAEPDQPVQMPTDTQELDEVVARTTISSNAEVPLIA